MSDSAACAGVDCGYVMSAESLVGGSCKPNPKMYVVAQKELGRMVGRYVEGGECVMVAAL